MDNQERVICAAIWYDDGTEQVHQPVPTGIVIGGWRHHNIINSVYNLQDFQKAFTQKEQGFLTNTGRFITRQEAHRIALAAGQTTLPIGKQVFTSEDLY